MSHHAKFNTDILKRDFSILHVANVVTYTCIHPHVRTCMHTCIHTNAYHTVSLGSFQGKEIFMGGLNPQKLNT